MEKPKEEKKFAIRKHKNLLTKRQREEPPEPPEKRRKFNEKKQESDEQTKPQINPMTPNLKHQTQPKLYEDKNIIKRSNSQNEFDFFNGSLLDDQF